MLICRRDFCPFDRKSYRHVFAVCFHLQLVVVDPGNAMVVCLFVQVSVCFSGKVESKGDREKVYEREIFGGLVACIFVG